MSLLNNTHYDVRRSDGSFATVGHPADVTLLLTSPTDTLIEVNPKDGDAHRIYWPGKQNVSGKPKVWKYVKNDGFVEDEEYSDYWVPAGKSALRNAKWNIFDRIGAYFRGVELPKSNDVYNKGGQINYTKFYK